MADQQPDLIAALLAFLLEDTNVNSECDGRIFGGELPPEVEDLMPLPAIVIRPAGSTGAFGQAYQEFGDRRVDLHIYGATMAESEALWRYVAPLLKQLRREVRAGCLMHWARSAGDAIPLRDPDTDWPYTLASYQVLAAEVTI